MAIKKDPVKNKKGVKSKIILVIIFILFLGIPLSILIYQARKSGLPVIEVIQRKLNRKASPGNSPDNVVLQNMGGKVDFLIPAPIGEAFTEPPQISNISAADLDGDGFNDVVVCDTRTNTISWVRQDPLGKFTESILAKELIAPAHVQVIDFDGDGDNDLIVAVLGMLFPSNDKIGSVVILENDGRQQFKKHLVAGKIARVSDVRAGDLDGDGDMDMAVAQFGYDDGETRWIENIGNWKFENHILQNLSGPINVEIVDIDNDNDLDIVSLVSQEWEEIYCFINDGKGNFDPKLLWGSNNEDFGSSGIFMDDLNKDGKVDILYTNGDAFDYMPPLGRPWHGVQWLENRGNLNFEFHRICNFIGAYSVRPADIDADGDKDLFAVSGFNLWDKPESQSFIWLENTGKMNFVQHDISNTPTHLITLEAADFNNDGQVDFVTGGMHTYAPFDRMGRITLWMNNKLKSGNAADQKKEE